MTCGTRGADDTRSRLLFAATCWRLPAVKWGLLLGGGFSRRKRRLREDAGSQERRSCERNAPRRGGSPPTTNFIRQRADRTAPLQMDQLLVRRGRKFPNCTQRLSKNLKMQRQVNIFPPPRWLYRAPTSICSHELEKAAANARSQITSSREPPLSPYMELNLS